MSLTEILATITDLLPAKYTESKQDELTIQFDGNEIVYPRNEWYKIRLAYAMSIHKSQGSEFPVVILPLTNQSRRMLQRNLIYTAITRSKSKLILLGEYTAFNFATKNTGTARKTYLIERFSDGTPQGRDSASQSPDPPGRAHKKKQSPKRSSSQLKTTLTYLLPKLLNKAID